MNKKILYLSDLNYVAKARDFYGKEDVYLTGRLKNILIYQYVILEMLKALKMMLI